MRVRVQQIAVSLLMLGGLTIGSGCGSSQDHSATSASSKSDGEHHELAPMVRQSERGSKRSPRMRFGNLDHSEMSKRTTDVNGDGTVDQYEYFKNGRLFFVQRDLDFDGKPDLYEYYRASGELVEQEFQLDHDDVIDAVSFYENGQIVEKIISTTFERGVSIWKFYDASGTLARMERDTTHDGQPDEWSYYDKGKVVRIESDTNGDGEPDEELEIAD